MDTIVSVANVMTVGAYGAMLAICVFVVELCKRHAERRKEAELQSTASEKAKVAAERAVAVAQAERDAAVAERAKAIEATADAQAKVARLYSAGTDLAQQVGWRRTKVMGGSEYRVYQDLQAVVAKAAKGHLLFPQVACGAFLQPAPTPKIPARAADARHVLNRKYVDFLLVDWRGMPCAVLEYQGADHYRANAYDRDQAKRIACHKAGIAFIEIPADGLMPAQRAAILQVMGCVHSVAAE